MEVSDIYEQKWNKIPYYYISTWLSHVTVQIVDKYDKQFISVSSKII